MSNWIKLTEDNIPRGNVLARVVFDRSERNMPNYCRTIIAFYQRKFEVESQEDRDYDDYDEESGQSYEPEGWYESLECDSDYCGWRLEDCEVTHFQPLPSTDL